MISHSMHDNSTRRAKDSLKYPIFMTSAVMASARCGKTICIHRGGDSFIFNSPYWIECVYTT